MRRCISRRRYTPSGILCSTGLLYVQLRVVYSFIFFFFSCPTTISSLLASKCRTRYLILFAHGLHSVSFSLPLSKHRCLTSNTHIYDAYKLANEILTAKKNWNWIELNGLRLRQVKHMLMPICKSLQYFLCVKIKKKCICTQT